MADQKFEYDEKVLEECAESDLAAIVLGKASLSDASIARHLLEASPSGHSCLQLFSDHAKHYNRNSFSTVRPDPFFDQRGYIYDGLDDGLNNFVRNAVFVHQHNQKPDVSHKVALNRFADMNLDSVFSETKEIEENDENLLRPRKLRSREHGDYSYHHLRPFGSTQVNQGSALESSDNHFQKLEEYDMREVPSDLKIGRGSFYQMHTKSIHKKYLEDLDKDYIVRVPNNQQDYFEASHVTDWNFDGELFSIKRNHEEQGKHVHHHSSHHQYYALDANMDNDFSTYLNWATERNPDGVPIVNPAFDQGTCGACWAFAAAGSVEASAARHEAYLSYQSVVGSYTGNRTKDAVQDAIRRAQLVEAKAFSLLNLSVQELIDCDTAADQGCIGGNPLLAFYFINRYGLSSWHDYPYSYCEDSCQKQRVRQPVASVKNWGVISPNHENHMEMVIRYIGPIAVGVNAAEHSFLTYSGGIYDPPLCKQSANHALLIVGYGQETSVDGSIRKYWICRNSWGRGYGENGMVRIARIGGPKGFPGVCGIARSPSVALGGFLLNGDALESKGAGRGSVQALEYSPVERLCLFLDLSLESRCGMTANWVDAHRAVVTGSVGFFFALMSIWLLSKDWRRRRRILRLRKQDLATQKKYISSDATPHEATSLISSRQANSEKYGTTVNSP